MTSKDIVFKKNGTTSKVFGSNISVITVANSAIQDFYFSCNNGNNEVKALEVYEELIVNRKYLEIYQYIDKKLGTSPDRKVKLGSIDGYLEASISFSGNFTQDKILYIGDVKSTLQEMLSTMKEQFDKNASFEIGDASKLIKLFFNTFHKSELSTIKNFEDKILLFKSMQNNLSAEDEAVALQYAKKYCMSKSEASKRDSFFKRFFKN